MSSDSGNWSARLSRFVPWAVGAVCLAPFVPLLTRQDAVVSAANRDYAVMHLPLAEFARGELLAGRLPLWNPYLACGQPLQAAQQAMLFYPLLTPVCVLCGANGGLKLALFAHLALCYAGTFFLARRTGLSRHGGSYAALAMTWSGSLMGNLAEGHAGAVFETALAPWFFLALVHLLASPSAMASMRLAAVGALGALAAQPQILYYMVVAGACLAAGSLWRGEAAAHRARAIGWGVTATVVALLIAAVQLVPVIELMRDGLTASERGTSGFGATYALDGADGPRLLMPYLNGTPFGGVAQFDATDHYQERVVYLGLAAPVLAAFGLSRVATLRWQWPAAWGVVVALAIAFGDSTAVFGLLGHLLPGLLFFRCPGRIFAVASLAAVLLAGRGLDALAGGEARAGRYGLRRLALVALAATAVPGYAALRLAPEFDWGLYAQYARRWLLGELSLWAILAADTAAILALAATRRLRGAAVWLPLLAVGALDLGYFNVGNFRMEKRERVDAERLPPADVTTRFVEAAAFPRVSDHDLRYSRWTRATITEHRPAVGTYDGGVLPGATSRLYRAIEANPAPVLELAACRFSWGGAGTTRDILAGGLRRLRFVPNGTGAAEARADEITDADLSVLRESSTRVRLVRATPGDLEIEFTAPADGWLVVADTYYRGWTCRADGQPRPIERAHDVFRRVRLEAGRHRVVMTYEPLSFRIGVGGTLVGLLMISVITAVHLRSRRPSSRIARSPAASGPE